MAAVAAEPAKRERNRNPLRLVVESSLKYRTPRSNVRLGLECDASSEAPEKYAPFYGDIYGPAFFGPLISFNSFHGMPFASDNPDAVSAMASPLLSSRRSFYQAVPTEETSLRGRERRKEQTRQDIAAEATRPFHYMSAVCGAAFPGAEVDLFTNPLQRPVDRTPAVYTSTMAAPGSYGDAVLHSDVSELLQQLLSEDFYPAAPETPESEKRDAEHVESRARAVTSCTRQRLERKISGRTVSRQHETRPSHSDDMKDCIAVLAPQMKRKRVTREGAYKRKKNSTVHEGRSSRFRGVTKHRRSGRWEAHIWIKEMGRQVYLGGYEKEEHAAEAYDVAAIKSKGDKVKTNFDISKYADLRTVMDSITMDELVMIVRRQSQGFSRGTSVFRGVTHHPSGRWEARIGIPGEYVSHKRHDARSFPGSKHIYLGLYNDEFEAAKWYDRALVRLRGPTAATNFLLSNYQEELSEYHEVQQAIIQCLFRRGFVRDRGVLCSRGYLRG